MLVPKLKICIESDCKTINLYDETLAFSDTNEGGWGSTNPAPSELVSAYIEITYPDNSEETITLDVSDLPTSVTTEFLLSNIDTTTVGKYTFKYYTETEDYTAMDCVEIFNICTLRCCVDKLWVKYFDNSCGCENNENKALEAESLYRAIMNASGSLKSETRDSLVKKLQRICNMENCNCN